MLRRHGHAPGLLVATATAAVLAGCGSSAPSDQAQIAAIITREGTKPATLCDHLTTALLGRLGGRAGCQRQAASAAADPTTRATAIRVRGRSATALVTDRMGKHTLSFVKRRGSWKVSAVG